MAMAINFVLDAGTLFEAVAVIENEDSSLFDLTDKVPYCQMRRSYYTNTAYDIGAEVLGNPLAGEIKLTLNPDESQSIRSGRYVYDVELHSTIDTTYVKRIFQGFITVKPQVTRTPAV